MMEKFQRLTMRRLPTRITLVFLLLLLTFGDVCVVLGFVKWAPIFATRSNTKTTTNMKAAMEKFPTALNMPMPAAGMVQAFSLSKASSNFITPERLEDLQQTVDIVSVIESYGLPRFSRRGQFRATCLCPFHDDRNPSMSIDSSRGIYKCFSCGAGGDVISFVREYSKIQGKELSFSEAVTLVESQFASGDGAMVLDPGMRTGMVNRTGSNITNGGAAFAKNAPREFQTSRKRIMMANAATAAFYEKCLGLPSAGLARRHLKKRGMQPRTIRAFALGYAPDAYFNPQASWGQGSLVEHLQKEGFTSKEILDAGLATVLKKDARKIEIEQEKDQTFMIPHSSLMDRFRGRLVVPILDASGLQVLGFGGRVLLEEGFTLESENFAGPKYLNSPESPVFQKKNILFGQHMASKALRFWDMEEHIARAVVVVEGYMDAIALWQAGVREAVACMGTSLTEEQITAAAALAGDKNGRVIFCMDNDDAGIAAVERICRSGILASVSASYPVEFRVALLPDGVKDPADYISLPKEDSRRDETFRLEILERNSKQWMDWYQHRTITQYNSTATTGEKWSLSDVMDRLGALLSMIKDSIERQPRFDEIVDILVNIVASDSDEGGVSEVVRLQIQSELERKVSMMSRTTKMVPMGALAKIERSADELSKTLARMAPLPGDLPPSTSSRKQKPRKVSPRGRRQADFRTKTTPARRPSLTPHFAGFQFQDKHAAAWLDDEELLGKRRYASKVNKGDNTAVYFNSNEYHGEQFLTDEAMSVGYINTIVPRDPDLLTKGINSMVGTNTDELLLSAENDLLRTLLYFPSARSSLHRIMSIRESAGSEDPISWSSPEKAWLFDRLTKENTALEGFDRTNLADFLLFLSSDSDALNGLLSNATVHLTGSAGSFDVGEGTRKEPTARSQPVLSPSSPHDSRNRIISRPGDANEFLVQRGPLDHLFNVSGVEEDMPMIVSVEQAALRVQECYYAMQWSAAVQLLNQKLRERAFVELSKAEETENLENARPPTKDSDTKVVVPEQDYIAHGIEIRQAAEKVRLLAGALKNLSSRLVQKAMPQSLLESWNQDYHRLSSRLEKHMIELDHWLVHEDEIHPVKDSEAYETILEQAQEVWGELYDDDHFWSPDDVVSSQSLASSGHEILVATEDGGEVSVAEFSAKLDDEWGWLNDPRPEVARAEKPGLYEFDGEVWDEFLRFGRRGGPDQSVASTTVLSVEWDGRDGSGK